MYLIKTCVVKKAFNVTDMRSAIEKMIDHCTHAIILVFKMHCFTFIKYQMSSYLSFSFSQVCFRKLSRRNIVESLKELTNINI